VRARSARPADRRLAGAEVKGFAVSAWDAIVVPAGMSKPIIDKLNAVIRVVLADPELPAKLAARGIRGGPRRPGELSKYITSKIIPWGDAVKRSGASVD
jgi:tripartite-type tricarboxylate transporter receptor subunit TctC